MAKTESGKPDDSADVRLVMRAHIWQIQAVRDLLFVAAVVFILWAGYLLRTVTVPLLVALLLAYLFEPLVSKMTKHPKRSRPLAVLLILAAGGGAILITLLIVVPLVVVQTSRLIDDVRDGTMRNNFGRITEAIPEPFRENIEEIIGFLPEGAVPQVVESAIEDADSTEDGSESDEQSDKADDESTDAPDTASSPGDRLLDEAEVRRIVNEELSAARAQEEAEPRTGAAWWEWIKRSVGAILQTIGFIVSIGLLAFLIPFYFFFFSVWYPSIIHFGRNLIPEKNKQETLRLFEKMDAAVAGFVRGRIVISIIMGAMLAVGWFICGVPYAVVLGLVIGIFCAVPYLGVVGIPLAVGLLFVDQLAVDESQRMAWWLVILWPSLVFAVVQLIEGYVLTPLIAGKATNLDPVTILVAVLAGGSVLGVYGMLLAIPIAACGKILITEVLLPKVHAWTRGEASDPLPIDSD